MTIVLKKQQIVVLDDDLEIHELIVSYFKPQGFIVKCFSNAEDVLKESFFNGKNCDVLLTDLRFPKLSGIDFTVQLKKILPNLPIILITTSRSAEIAVQAIQKGAYDFVVKPIRISHLQLSVDRALHLNELKQDLSHLRERVKNANVTQGNMVGRSPKFLAVVDIARRVALSSTSIFITGESGTGKELFAKFIHNESKCKKGPFVAINCSAIPENLLESELFGHAKGSFTGAVDKKVGLFEEAQNGTLFLDEIGDLSLSLQAKLLRVLQEKKIKRVGENVYRLINCRIISATHKDLSIEVNEKRFREDLFFRMNVIPLFLPPLRDRIEDVLPLAEAFLKRFAIENDSHARVFSKEAIKYILDNPWRGNVRELENSIERAVVLSSDTEISLENFMPSYSGLNVCEKNNIVHDSENYFSVECHDQLPDLDSIIQKYIEFAVHKNGGARDKTAKEIGIDRKTLYKRLKLDAVLPILK